MSEPLPYFTPGRERLVPVASFPNGFVAELACGALNAAGIPAFLAGAHAAALGASANGIAGVQLFVAFSDVAAARTVLSENAPRVLPELADAPPWACVGCREEVPGNFELCWNCGSTRAGEADPDFASAVSFNPLCKTCGYLLIGLPSNVCPECGGTFDPEDKS